MPKKSLFSRLKEGTAKLVKKARSAIAGGGKKADGIWRRTFVANSNADMILNPIWDWNKYDVLAYLKAKNIPIPVTEGTVCSGVDVSSKFLKWCYTNYPKDFEKMKEEFPFIEAVIYKEQYFGKKDSKNRKQQ